MENQKTKAEPKKKKNGNRKGGDFERKIAKVMTEWTGVKFERVPASGGLHWKKDNRVYGDIVCNDPTFPFVVECKNRQSWNMDALIKGNKAVEKWWAQVNKDATDTQLTPMLIFTRNQQPDYIMLTAECFAEGLIEMSSGSDPDFWMSVRVGGELVHIFNLEEFMEQVTIQWTNA